MNERTFDGQHIVITGGSGGIGLALAGDLLARGAGKVVLTGRDTNKLAHAAKSLGSRVETATFDVTSEDQVARFFSGQPVVDHLVTVAAGTVHGSVAELEVAKARALFEPKYWGQYLCCKYGAPRLAKRGSIVLFSGWISRKPTAGVSALAAVDAAIEELGRTLALEIAPRRVNTVVQGMIETPLWAARLSPDEQKAHFQKVGAGLPVGRAGLAEDVAHACRFLMENGFTTGATLDVDGGQR